MLPGTVFTRWTIIRRLPNREWGDVYECECQCGVRRPVLGTSLRSGRSKSCRCLAIKDNTGRNRVLQTYHSNARNRGLNFELTDDQFNALIAGNCFYCAQPASNHQRTVKGPPFLYNGIDRKDPIVGYIYSNVVSYCRVCNDMKGTMNFEDFLAHIKRILDKHLAI